MKTKHQRLAILALCKAALQVAPQMPTTERADLFEGIALACKSADPQLAKEAAETCEAIRAAALQQMTFLNLFNAAVGEAKGARS